VARHPAKTRVGGSRLRVCRGRGVKAGFGIVVGEKVDVGEDPAETEGVNSVYCGRQEGWGHERTVYKEDNALCWGAILGLSDVGF
jgi:hypothetical protein